MIAEKRMGMSLMALIVIVFVLVATLGMSADAFTISKTGGNPSKTGTTDFTYQGFKNHSTLGAVSENKYRTKVSGTGGVFMGVQGVYSEHDHYRRQTTCGITSVSVHVTGFGLGWGCNANEWVRFKNDDRSALYKKATYSSYFYSRASLGTFQPKSVGVGTRTCLDLNNSPNVCSNEAQDSKDV